MTVAILSLTATTTLRTSLTLISMEPFHTVSHGTKRGKKMLQIALIIVTTLFFFILERVLP